MRIDKRRRVVETDGSWNDVCRIARALGFRLATGRGLSPRSERYRGFAETSDRRGRVWHIVG